MSIKLNTYKGTVAYSMVNAVHTITLVYSVINIPWWHGELSKLFQDTFLLKHAINFNILDDILVCNCAKSLHLALVKLSSGNRFNVRHCVSAP